jgi:hypothetical protein
MAGYSFVHGENNKIVGIWFRDPAIVNPEMIATALDWGLNKPAGGSPAMSSDQVIAATTAAISNYRIVPNKVNQDGGCFVMFGATLAPGEKNASTSGKKWWQFWK